MLDEEERNKKKEKGKRENERKKVWLSEFEWTKIIVYLINGKPKQTESKSNLIGKVIFL